MEKHHPRRILALNFKTYAESAGLGGYKLASIADQIAASHPFVTVIVCPQQNDVSLFVREFKNVRIFAQACDPVAPGAFTGWLSPDCLKLAGAHGSLVNHSEHHLPDEKIAEVVSRSRECSFHNIVCAGSIEKTKEIAKLDPWAVAYEPPNLIGSGISVSTAKPSIVQEGAKALGEHRSIFIVGAGVSTPDDVRKCIELGAQGALLASAYVKSKSPAALLDGMLKEMEKAEPIGG